MPETDRFMVECRDGEDIRRHGVVVDVALNDTRQPPPLFWDGQMPATHELGLDLAKLRSHPFPHRVPK
jgi:hypothetical protein